MRFLLELTKASPFTGAERENKLYLELFLQGKWSVLALYLHNRQMFPRASVGRRELYSIHVPVAFAKSLAKVAERTFTVVLIDGIESFHELVLFDGIVRVKEVCLEWTSFLEI